MHDIAPDPLAEFRRVNVQATLNLARQAAHAGVRRFMFLSSIRVNGDETMPGQPFTADDPPSPVGPYGVSKDEAERGLWLIAAQTGMGVGHHSPPVVYGAGVKGNFLSMIEWLRKGVPLPAGVTSVNATPSSPSSSISRAATSSAGRACPQRGQR